MCMWHYFARFRLKICYCSWPPNLPVAAAVNVWTAALWQSLCPNPERRGEEGFRRLCRMPEPLHARRTHIPSSYALMASMASLRVSVNRIDFSSAGGHGVGLLSGDELLKGGCKETSRTLLWGGFSVCPLNCIVRKTTGWSCSVMLIGEERER